MAMATCVLTWRSWFSMSRTSCLQSFSGSSAFSMRSLMLARKSVPTRSSNAMVNLLSVKRCAEALLPATAKDAVKSDEREDGQKSAGEVAPPVATPIAVVAVRAVVGTMETVGVPEQPEEDTEDHGNS